MKIFSSVIAGFIGMMTLLHANDSKEFKIGGAATFIEPVVKSHLEEIQKDMADCLKISSVSHNAIAGLKMLLDENIQLAVVSNLENLKKNEKVKDHKNIKDVKSEDIASGKILIVVHKDVSIDKLTKDQLKDIFSGKIKNWKDVGGKDEDILVVSGKGIGIQKTIEEKLLSGESMTQKVAAENPIDAIKLVSKKPGSIGFYGDVLSKETKKLFAANKVKVVEIEKFDELTLSYVVVFLKEQTDDQKWVIKTLKKVIADNA
ncbi:MAG: hypothetical protein CNLJKLNK_01085 [Holosporales bacterium]